MSKRIPFNIKYRPQIESGEYKVETRDGRPARIICWDIEYYYPQYKIGALIKNDEGEDFFFLTEKGYFCIKESGECDSNNDLLIVTPEEERTKFEQELVNFFNEGNAILPDKDGMYNKRDCEEFLHKSASKLLAIAEKELTTKYKVSSDYNGFVYGQGYKAGMEDALKEKSRNITVNLLDSKITGIQHELIQFASNIMEADWKDIVETSESYAQRIRAHVLKDLPRWKKIGQGDNYSSKIKFCINGRYLEMNDTLNDLYEISLKDLDKLPKEEEK